MVGNIVRCRQSRCQRGSTSASAGSRKRLGHIRPGLSFWNLRAAPSDTFPPTMPHLLQKGHLSIVSVPSSLWGLFLQTTTCMYYCVQQNIYFYTESIFLTSKVLFLFLFKKVTMILAHRLFRKYEKNSDSILCPASFFIVFCGVYFLRML